jgi:hypothetical protein
VLLQPVQPEVALAGLRMPGVGQAEVVEHSPVVGPRVQTGQAAQIDVSSLVDLVLTGRGLHPLRGDGLELHQLAQPFADAGPADRQFGPHEFADAGADLVEVVDSQRHRHPLRRAEQVDRHRHVAPGRPLEQQRLALRPDGARDDLAQFEGRVHRDADAVQFTGAFERAEKVLEILIGKATRHGPQSASAPGRPPTRR